MALVFTAALFGGCRKDICYEYHPLAYKVFVMVHDDHIDVPLDEMRVDFFLDGTDKVFTRFVRIGGDSVELPRGRYSSVVFNDNSDYIAYTGAESLQSYKAYLPFITRSQYNALYGGQFVPYSQSPVAVSPSARAVPPPVVDKGAAPMVAIGQPDPLFCDTNDGFDVTGDSSTQQELHFTPQNMVVAYHLRVDVTGMRNVYLSRGRIKTGAHAKYLYSRQREFVDGVSIMFDCACSDTGVSTVVTSFGLILGQGGAGSSDANVVTFEFLLKDGSVATFDFDITDRLTEETCLNGGEIDLSGFHITIDDVDAKGGFDPKLEDWGEEENIQL